MKRISANWYALSLSSAAALLAACGGSLPPIGVPGAVPQSRAITQHANRSATSGDLLYAVGGNGIIILSYPEGSKVGTLTTDIGQNLCVDASSGSVFAVNDREIFEYAHGGTEPIATLNSPSSGYDLMGCAVDPSTGNLAVAALNLDHKPSAVLVYPAAKNPPAIYSDSNAREFDYCGYDGDGNLFVDGATYSAAPLLDELSDGSSALQEITVNRRTSNGPVQWDGSYLTIEAPSPPTIYRIKVSGSVGTVVGKTKIRRDQTKTRKPYYSLTWIEGSLVIAAEGPRNKFLAYWNYPTGGKPFEVLRQLTTKSFYHGLVVSHGVSH